MAGVRLVSWNILEGFHAQVVDGEEPSINQERLAAAREVLADLSPDILVLNEALWCRPYGGRHVDYASLLGFDHTVADLYDKTWGNAILSRIPPAATRRFRIYNRGGVSASYMVGDQMLTVATYHPHPSRWPEHKAEDYCALADAVDGPLAICGDMNAVHPDDPTDRQTLISAFARFSRSPEADLDRFLDGGRAVFPALESRGLRDAIPPSGRRPSIPTDLISPHKDSGMRIDHILVNASVAVSGGEVVRHPAAERASDHYPVVVDICPLAPVKTADAA